MKKSNGVSRKYIFVCTNAREDGRPSCAPRGSVAIREHMKALVKKEGLIGKIRVSKSGCLDLCTRGPNVLVFPDNVLYESVSLEDAAGIISDISGRKISCAPA